ncbi:MAG TPA: hypothetical protein VKR30_08295 [Candidatus Limnocylindrales bacterium]|nr:hypothetical protein [Candidatus Limnocylindrales bacterium]
MVDHDETKGTIARAGDVVADTVVDVATAAVAAAGRLIKGDPTGRRRLARTPLANLFELHPDARSAPRRELGTMTIPVARVLGTAVEGSSQRAADFRPFPPLRGSNWEARWRRLRAAHARLEPLPPIDVFHAADGYWVVDGHNRVALARLEHQDDIDANVVHLHLPGSDDANLRTAALATVLDDSAQLRAATRRPSKPADEDDPGR